MKMKTIAVTVLVVLAAICLSANASQSYSNLNPEEKNAIQSIESKDPNDRLVMLLQNLQ